MVSPVGTRMRAEFRRVEAIVTMLSEAEAAQALGDLVRERAAAGLGGCLNEVQAALFLRSLAEVRSLPEATHPGLHIPKTRDRTGRGRRLIERPLLRGGRS
jgi:hypothetical protein